MRAADIALLLPQVYQRAALPGSPLAALLEVMAALHEPVEEVLRDLPGVLDPLTCPDRFVPMLAAWVDLDRLDRTGAGRLDSDRLRLLVHLAAELGRTRGTAPGLDAVVRAATGAPECRIVPDGPFRVRVALPGATPGQVELAREVIAQEKPAHLAVLVLESGEDGAPEETGP